MTPFDREMTIVNDLAQGLQEVGGQFVLPFAFKSERGERTSHHLIFVSKHFRGYHIMKEVMYKLSSGEEGAVKSFEYTPVKDQQLRLLFDLGLEHSIPALKRDILNVFDSRTLSVQQVYERHSVGKPYILRNYKDALKELESEGHVSVDIPAEKRPRRKGEVTLADSRLVTFHEIERTG